jgi:restriction endonuclease S subunit
MSFDFADLGSVTINHDGKRKPVKESERKSGPYPYFGASGVVDYVDGYIFDGEYLLIGEDGENLRTRQTPIAFMAKGKFWVNNHAHIVTANEKSNTRFLMYALQNADIQPYLTGAVMPKLTQGNLNKIQIPLPSLPIQNHIAKILGALDDKIELNRQTNQTLEQIAQALFKSWFVDFEPTRAKIAAKEAGASPEEIERAAMCAISGKTPDQLAQLPPETQQNLKTTAALFPDALVDSELGEVPEGWEVKAMGKYVEIKRGGSPRPIQDFMAETGFPWTKISDATAEASPFLFRTKEFIKEEGLKKTVLLKKGTLILSNSATPGLPKFLELDACIHDGWLYFPSKSHFSDIYLFHLFLVLKESFISQGNGSIFTNLKTDILRNQTIVIPPLQLLHAFESIANHIFGVVRGNCRENIDLVVLRDSLLPKLLSGEVVTGNLLHDLQNTI